MATSVSLVPKVGFQAFGWYEIYKFDEFSEGHRIGIVSFATHIEAFQPILWLENLVAIKTCQSTPRTPDKNDLLVIGMLDQIIPGSAVFVLI